MREEGGVGGGGGEAESGGLGEKAVLEVTGYGEDRGTDEQQLVERTKAFTGLQQSVVEPWCTGHCSKK